MKKSILATFLLAVGLLSGCATAPGAAESQLGRITRALDAALPANFIGDAHVQHSNPYLSITIDAGGLKRTEKGWEFTWLIYRRNGLSHGTITLGTPPKI
jgi:hypothetical protein